MSRADPPPILVITGPTASGKSTLALDVASRLDGEIVSADAYAIYRGLDIGTDKPDAESRKAIRHHLIDIVDPRQGYSAGQFIVDADRAIAEILSRRKTVVVAGGAQFYLEALLHGLFSSPARDPALRRRLESAWHEDPDRVFERLRAVDGEAADRIGRKDRQRILRALEVYEATGAAISEKWSEHEKNPRYRALFAAPERPREQLYDRIDRRVERMFAEGFVEEVERIRSTGVPDDSSALKAIGYREIVDHLDGRCSRTDAVERTKRASRKYAKRQLSWLRNKQKGELHWVPPQEDGGASQILILWSEHLRSSGFFFDPAQPRQR